MPHLFSYGTLQNPAVQLKMFGRTLQGSKDHLPGYRLATVVVSDQRFLDSGENSNQKTLVLTGNRVNTVQGTIFKLSEQELLTADKYEPDNYHRVELSFASGKLAWVFVAQE